MLFPSVAASVQLHSNVLDALALIRKQDYHWFKTLAYNFVVIICITN